MTRDELIEKAIDIIIEQWNAVPGRPPVTREDLRTVFELQTTEAISALVKKDSE